MFFPFGWKHPLPPTAAGSSALRGFVKSGFTPLFALFGILVVSAILGWLRNPFRTVQKLTQRNHTNQRSGSPDFELVEHILSIHISQCPFGRFLL